MLLNLFFLTITISKRKYSDEERQKEYNRKKAEAYLNEVKSKSYDHQMNYM